MHLLLLTALLSGCDRECVSATCVADEAVRGWPTDEAGVTARVVALPDDITRTVVVSRLCEAYPGQTGELCRALPQGDSRTRCERLNGRPHLSTEATRGVPSPMSGGAPDIVGAPPVPNRSTNPLLPVVPLTLAPPRSPPETCASAPDRGACLDAAAADAARAGDFGRASATCALHAQVRFVDECRFNAAEEAVRADHQNGYPGAAALCGEASAFTQECLTHLLSRLPRRIAPPNADGTGAHDAAMIADRIRLTWEAGGEEVARSHVARFWAFYFANAYQQTQAPDGTPMLYYPEEAWPHVRAAAAMRLRELGRLSGPLDAQLALLQAVLAHQEGHGPRRGKAPGLVYVADVGVPVTEGPVTWFLGTSLRPTDPDPAVDALFCLLETAGRGQPPDRAVLEEASRHPNPRVAAEAARILAAVAGSSG